VIADKSEFKIGEFNTSVFGDKIPENGGFEEEQFSTLVNIP
jgi:hypothetical protein